MALHDRMPAASNVAYSADDEEVPNALIVPPTFNAA
jgi:hypothetical protein